MNRNKCRSNKGSEGSIYKRFFDALGANGATQMLDIPADGFDGFGTILVALIESENRTKIAVKNLFKTVFSYLKRMDMKAALHKKQGMQGLGLFLLGILFICFPKFAVNGIGTGIMAVGFLWSARKLLGTALCEDMERIRKRRRLLAEMFFMSLFAVLVFQKSVLTITINLAIGSLLLVYAYMKSKKIFLTKEKNRYGKVFGGFMAVMSFMLGMVSLARKLEQIKATVYEYSGSVPMHTKTVLIDDNLSIIGSFNMDNRSTYIDTEIMLVIDCRELNAGLRQQIINLQEQSVWIAPDGKVTYGTAYREKRIPVEKRFLYGILRVLLYPFEYLL